MTKRRSPWPRLNVRRKRADAVSKTQWRVSNVELAKAGDEDALRFRIYSAWLDGYSSAMRDVQKWRAQ